jgi:hypothetical protein
MEGGEEKVGVGERRRINRKELKTRQVTPRNW